MDKDDRQCDAQDAAENLPSPHDEKVPIIILDDFENGPTHIDADGSKRHYSLKNGVVYHTFPDGRTVIEKK